MLTAVAAVLIAVLVTGCMQPASYVDPAYGKVGYADLTRRAIPYEWRLAAEFRRNGTRVPGVDTTVLGHVERAVRASGLAVPTASSAAPELKVILNNIADLDGAVAKGVATGLTLGLIGSHVTDRYEMEAVLTDGGTVIRKSGYRHAIHSTVGNASGPAGARAMSTSEAFASVVEQLVLGALRDVDKEYAGRVDGAGPIASPMILTLPPL